MKRNIHNPHNFGAISIQLASPETILDWSHGEVTKPETINYRTQRSEKNGLFDERIFGPERDFECYCGKYKGIRYKGIVCEKCGVEITRSIVRRERMGHITLATPVSHIWFLRNIPSRIALILGVSAGDLEKVIYFASYIVRGVSESERETLLKDLEAEYKTKTKSLQDEKSKTKLKEVYLATKKEINSIHIHAIFDEATYTKYAMKYGELFEAGIGAETVYEICKEIDLETLVHDIETQLEKASAIEKKKLQKRLSLVRGMITSNGRPEWMFLTNIPVIPAALRPMVALEGGRHATSDLNDLYRRVINRNNRLKKLLEINAPSVILRNEKRILQEAVDALIDNSMRKSTGAGAAVSQAQRRPLKSLADNLKGKQGIFRQNLLGKRVDYSARSVIVVGPNLSLDQCGLPKHMALELFRPFVIAELIKREYAYNIRGAGRLIDEKGPEVWEMLEHVIQDKYVMLNRAPTLHRLGIQAFRPVLIEGNAIQIHPLVVSAFNADFDGDQMAVHLPLSEEAQLEAKEIVAANKNFLRPGTGASIMALGHQDMVLGCFWVTTMVDGEKGEGKVFANPNDAIAAYDYGLVSLRAKVKVRPTDTEKYAAFNGELFETSVGRLLFNTALPSDYPYISVPVKKKEMAHIVSTIVVEYDTDQITEILDKIKAFGFKYSTVSGTTFGFTDVSVPEKKYQLIEEAQKKADEITTQYEEGLLSESEKYRMIIEIWHGVRSEMGKVVMESIPQNSSIYNMITSGARGNEGQANNMMGLKGVIAGASGRAIETPIISSVKEGFTPIEYFVNTHSSRKGLGDTALNTAQSGYFTRKLFSVAQEIVITEEDCKTKNGVHITHQNLEGIELPIHKNISGRFLAKDLVDVKGAAILKRNTYIGDEERSLVENADVEEAWVRSPMTCETLQGVCQKCYGKDLGSGHVVALGEAVGTVAAQSMGEPATQLTMRTFHGGGLASAGGDITQGLPRVTELFERRPPKNPAVVAKESGTVIEILEQDNEKIIRVLPDAGEKKKTAKKGEATEYVVHYHRMALVQKGDAVEKGQLLTDGSADLTTLFKYAGRERTQAYIINEARKIYELQGASVSPTHIEIIVRQMFSRVQVKDAGDTPLLEGTIIETAQAELANLEAKEAGKEEAKIKPLLLGITNVALSRTSFLSAASFQHTTKVLINNAVEGRTDELSGLKENIIIGRLIPAGTGFEGGPKAEMIRELQEQYTEEDDI